MSTSGSLTDILPREGLRLNAISEKDVTIIPVGDLGGRLSGLQTGRIHGVHSEETGGYLAGDFRPFVAGL